MLLTELDYLVNVNINDNLPSITYSGVKKRDIVLAGSKKIPITNIDHYLYCPNKESFLDNEYQNDTINFPCWIIFLRNKTENNFNALLQQQHEFLNN